MKRALAILLGGGLFGFGLAWSGMSQPEVVLRFLHLEDLGLLLVMGGAIAVVLPTYQLFRRRPLLGGERAPFRAWLDRRTTLGAVLFGIGWGISGACPGAAIASLGTGNTPILIVILAMFAGAAVEGLWPRR